jgi:DNA ligase (NAD+)
LKLAARTVPDVLEVRGEVYMERKAFDRMNQLRVKAGEKPFMNPRNATTGSLKTLDTAEVARRPLQIFIYQLVHADRHGVKTHWDALQLVAKMGLRVNPDNAKPTASTTFGSCATDGSKARALSYGVDGP